MLRGMLCGTCVFMNLSCPLLQAEEFHSTVHMLLEWLAEAEQSLRFHGTLPDDEEALGALIEQHKASDL